MQMDPSANILHTQLVEKWHFFWSFLTDFETWVRHLRHPFTAATVAFLPQTLFDCTSFSWALHTKISAESEF